MRLVVDTNILFSFFRDNPVRFIIINSDLLNLELLSPDYAIQELQNKKQDLLKYIRLSSNQLEEIFLLLHQFIKVVSMQDYEAFMEKASEICPDKKDIPFFALALNLNSPIWSNEPGLKNQPEVKVYNTKELREFLKI